MLLYDDGMILVMFYKSNRSPELMILIALGHIDSIPAAGGLKRFEEAFPIASSRSSVVEYTNNKINLLRDTGWDDKYQSQSFATRWEAESMTRCIMFINACNQK